MSLSYRPIDIMMKGYDMFVTAPGKVAVMTWRVCGQICEAERNVCDSPGFAMAGVQKPQDVFRCPHAGLWWHRKALALYREVQQIASPTLRQVVLYDLADVLEDALGETGRMRIWHIKRELEKEV